MITDIPATFVGRRTILHTVIRSDGKQVEGLCRNKWFPWASSFRPFLNNFNEYVGDYQLRDIIDLRTGVTQEKARVYFFDADTCKPFSSMLNPEQRLELEDLRVETTFLLNHANKLKEVLNMLGHQDVVRAAMKDEYDFYHNKLKPGYRKVAGPANKKK